MVVTDEDLELLESYVDGELPAPQEDALRRRLEAEPQLAATLETLRGERDVRAAVFAGYEPSEAAVRRVVGNIERKVDQHRAWAYRLSKYRVPTAAAACILIGFMVGWIGRGGSGGPAPLNTSPAGGGTNSTLATARPNPNVVLPAPVPSPVPGFTTVGAGAPAGGPVELPIVNEFGQQVGVQRFNSAREAAEFLEDLRRWQQRQEQAKQGNIDVNGSEKF